MLTRLRDQIASKQRALCQVVGNGLRVVNVLDANGRLLHSSPERVLLLGHLKDVNHHYAEFCHPDDVDRIERYLQDVLSHDSLAASQFRLRDVKGQYVEVRCYAVPIFENGNAMGLVSVVKEIKCVDLGDLMAELTFWRYIEKSHKKRTG